MTRRSRRRMQNEPSSGQPVILLNLSLFLMLLAFFIVLNSISSFNENKIQPILKNLQLTFSVGLPMDGENPSDDLSPAQAINQGSTAERIDALFNAQISGMDITQPGSRGIMVVEMPVEELDRVMTTAGQIDLTQIKSASGLQTYFLPTLVSLMRSAEQGTPYRLDMFLHIRDNPAVLENSDPRALRQTEGVLAGYAAALVKAGLPPEQIHIGVRQGNPDKASLYFRPAGDRR